MILSYFASAYIADAISSTADPADAHGDGSFSLIRCFSIRPPAISIVVSSHIGKSQSITTMTKRTLPRMYVVAGLAREITQIQIQITQIQMHKYKHTKTQIQIHTYKYTLPRM